MVELDGKFSNRAKGQDKPDKGGYGLPGERGLPWRVLQPHLRRRGRTGRREGPGLVKLGGIDGKLRDGHLKHFGWLAVDGIPEILGGLLNMGVEWGVERGRDGIYVFLWEKVGG